MNHCPISINNDLDLNESSWPFGELDATSGHARVVREICSMSGPYSAHQESSDSYKVLHNLLEPTPMKFGGFGEFVN